MKQSLYRETNRSSASQEILAFMDPKVHCRIHKRLLPLPILSKIDPVHAPLTYNFLKIHFGITFPSMHKGS